MVNILTSLAVVAAVAATVYSSPIERRGPSYNTALTWDEAITKAQSLLAKLTLEEKVSLASGMGWAADNCVGNINKIPKINFNGLCLQDSPAGIRFALNVSSFASALNVAATFDRTLMKRNGIAMGEEARGKGVNVLLAPVANMLRAPANGRAWEAQGADPYLTGASVAEIIKGIQDQGVIATIKHFIGNEQEHFRDGGNTIMDQRTLQEFYMRPFKNAIDAGAASVMCSYNRINGTYACESPEVMRLLKQDLNFKGFVMSDWWATHSTVPASLSGLDMVMPGTTGWAQPTFWWGKNLVDAVNRNEVPVSRIDDMALRILSAWVKLGQDQGFPAANFDSFNPGRLPQIDVQGNHKQHIREVGAASSILVKNDKATLPISADKYPRGIAVIGSDAFAPKEPLNSAGDHGENPSGTLAQGWGSGTANFPYLVAPIDGMTGPAKYNKVPLVGLNENYDLDKIKQTAAASDLAVVFVNSNSGEGYITVDGNEGDRNNLTLWNNGDKIVFAAASVQKTAVVIHSPGAVDMPWLTHPNVTAVIYALMPGQESGNAIADVLFGRVNPSGRLPFSVMADRTQYSADVSYHNDQVTYTEGIYVDYRYYDKHNVTPVFPFGHGLSYTSFGYSDLKVGTVSTRSASRVTTVSAKITNTGALVGNEVPQLYLGFPEGVDQPPKQLRGFDRVRINPGESTTVTFPLTRDDVSIFDVVSQKFVVPKGTFKVYVGASSRDIRLQGTLDINDRTSLYEPIQELLPLRDPGEIYRKQLPHRREAAVPFDGGVGARVEQDQCSARAVFRQGMMKRGFPSLIERIDLRPGFQQRFHHIDAVVGSIRRALERRKEGRSRVHAGATCDQKTDRIQATIRTRPRQRCFPVLVDGICVGPSAEDHGDAFAPSHQRGGGKRCQAFLVGSIDDVGAKLQKQPQNFWAARYSGFMQKSVALLLAGQVRSVLQKEPQGLQVAVFQSNENGWRGFIFGGWDWVDGGTFFKEDLYGRYVLRGNGQMEKGHVAKVDIVNNEGMLWRNQEKPLSALGKKEESPPVWPIFAIQFIGDDIRRGAT
ncbi:hypothetical protein HDU96_006998 [Phlyctochytrium bullatum]|nr:hypothetical protein HDU96_006998 [Phlyctochytrium bullatum]